MALKKILTSQEDFTGETKNTDKTAGLWKFNETEESFHSDEMIIAGAREVSEPTGFPRTEVDGIDEAPIKTKWKMDGSDAEISLTGGATIYNDESNQTELTKFHGKSLDLSTGTASAPSGTGGYGIDRTYAIWFRPRTSDMTGGWKVIATQRTASNQGIQVALYNGGLVVRAYSSEGILQIDSDNNIAPMKANVWQLFTLDLMQGRWYISVDGKEIEDGWSQANIEDNGQGWEFGAKLGVDRFQGLLGGMFIVDAMWQYEAKKYFDTASVTTALMPAGVTLSKYGEWELSTYNPKYAQGKGVYADSYGAIVEYSFYGEGIAWRTKTGPNLGIAEIKIDGKYAGEADLYSPTEKFGVKLFDTQGLKRGSHKITIGWTGEKNIGSTGTTLYSDVVEINPGYNRIKDTSGYGRDLRVVNFTGTNVTAEFVPGIFGNSFDFNRYDPKVEKTHLIAYNDGSLWTGLGKRLTVGGWIRPTTYGADSQFVPLFSTRESDVTPLIYISLTQGQVNLRLYNSTGEQVYNTTETTMTKIEESIYYYIGVEVNISTGKIQIVVGNSDTKKVWKSPIKNLDGTLNGNCTADLVLGKREGGDWYSGALDDWFFEKDSDTTADDMEKYFYETLSANAGSTNANVDAITSSGSVVLAKTGTKYKASGVLETRAVDLGEGIAGTGKIQIVGEYESGVTAIHDIQTRTSETITTEAWTPWEPITNDGEITSPNFRYMQIKVTLTTGNTAKTPKIVEIQIHEVSKAPYQRLGFSRPVILSQKNVREAVLDNAFDIIISEEVNGAQFVNFKLPYHDGKRQTIDNEKKVQFTDDIYRIRTVTDDKDSSGNTVTSVYAEADFYDLAFSDPVEPVEYDESLPTAPMIHALKGTGWNLGTVTVSEKRTWEGSEKNALLFLRKIQELWGGDLVFNNGEKTVDLVKVSGVDDGVVFAYRKNMTSIQKIVDSKELITKLFVYGKDGLNIEDANGGRQYLTDNTHTSEVRSLKIENNSFTNPYQLKEWATERLEELSKPRVSYIINVMDLSTLSGWEHESFNLGDTVTVDDQEMGIKVKTRIIRREYNAQEPWKTVIELSTKLRELGDEEARWKQSGDTLQDSDYVDRQDMSDMMVFNYLLNSRAEDGFAYWENSGFQVDNAEGFSGPSSFKVSGGLGSSKSLLQVVRPSHRDAYTVSAKISTRNLEKGPDAKVGMQVKIFYEDGTEETQFISL